MEQLQIPAEGFEAHRNHLRMVAYRMLGSPSEAEEAVQETWLRLRRAGTDSEVENLAGWLTTSVARVCLNMLHARKTRGDEPPNARVPEPVVTQGNAPNPEHQALIADSVGLALLVLLETLTPAERLCFVLHDLFAVPFEDISRIIGRSPTAARQLAARARRRVRGATAPDEDLPRQRVIVGAFFAGARARDLDALMEVLDEDVVLRSDGGDGRPGLTMLLHGPQTVAERALTFAHLAPFVSPAVVNGAAGVVIAPHGRPFSVIGFTVRRERIVEIDILADPVRIDRLDLAAVLD